MNDLFSRLAPDFAESIDATLKSGYYLRSRLFLDVARREAPVGGRVLDYGCGPGRLGYVLAEAGFHVLGVDTSEGMIAEARKIDRRGLNLEFRTIRDCGEVLEPKSVDAIVCSSVIEYVEHPAEMLRAFHTSLREPGVLIISYANKSSISRLRSARHANPMGPAQFHVWDWQGFRQLLSDTGFRVISRPKFFEWSLDLSPLGPLLRYVPWAGSLGLVAARAILRPQVLHRDQ